MQLLFVATCLATALDLIFVVLTIVFLRRCPVLKPQSYVGDGPRISVIIPARNEEKNIKQCVQTVLTQSYSQLEVIVVNDHSTDHTAAILAELAASNARLHIIPSEPLPEGWMGKNFAVHQGYQNAQGQWLLFLDADVFLHEDAVSAAYMAMQQRNVLFLSLWLRQQLDSFWVRIIQPVIITTYLPLDPWQLINNPAFPSVKYGNGQFIFIQRQLYESIGGHAAVRDALVEDQQLTGNVKKYGERLIMMNGTRVASTRMYTTLGGIWNGWAKNNFITLNRNFFTLLGGIAFAGLVHILPFITFVLGVIQVVTGETPLILAVSLGGIVFLIINRLLTRHFFSDSFLDVLFEPLGGLIFIGIMLWSALTTTFGHGVAWKGRTYPGLQRYG